MRAADTRGWGTPTIESAQRFDSKKLLQIVLVLRAGFEPKVMESIGSRGWRSTNCATTPPQGIGLVEYNSLFSVIQHWNIFYHSMTHNVIFCQQTIHSNTSSQRHGISQGGGGGVTKKSHGSVKGGYCMLPSSLQSTAEFFPFIWFQK